MIILEGNQMNKDIVNETQKAEWSGFSPKVCVLDYL
jgi:hypothetical protein